MFDFLKQLNIFKRLTRAEILIKSININTDKLAAHIGTDIRKINNKLNHHSSNLDFIERFNIKPIVEGFDVVNQMCYLNTKSIKNILDVINTQTEYPIKKKRHRPCISNRNWNLSKPSRSLY